MKKLNGENIMEKLDSGNVHEPVPVEKRCSRFPYLLCVLVVACTTVCFAACSGDGTASALVGTWQGTLPNGAVDELTFGPLNSGGEGQYSENSTAEGRVIAEVHGGWRIRVNPLLSEDSRTQVQVAWNDPNWGRQERPLAIREVTHDTLILGSVYTEGDVTYHRVG
jgi:hypothetical protein